MRSRLSQHSMKRSVPGKLELFFCLMLLICHLLPVPAVSADLICVQLWDPVCGCNGQTYSNSCTALQAGVSCIAYKGVCGSPVPDTTPPNTIITERPAELTTLTTATFSFTSTEPGFFFCQFNGGGWSTCTSPVVFSGLTAADYTFSVKARDQVGNEDLTPASYAWTVAASPSVCIANPECGTGFYCFKPAGNCSGSGICSPWTSDGYCLQVVDPVCGCNGLTYHNTCEASKAGVSIAYRGACGDIARIAQTSYGSIAEAYTAISGGDTIKLSDNELVEELVFNRPVNVLLQGGCDSGYITCDGMTEIRGSIVVVAGSVTMENITIM